MITAELNKIILYVTKQKGPDFSGYFHTPLKEKAVPFSSFAELVVELDKQFDILQFPQAQFARRSFTKEQPVHFERPQEVKTFSKHPMQKELMHPISRFLVHVQFRQNSGWQGSIKWLRKKSIEKHFRGTAELLYLINSALTADSSSQKLEA